MTDFENCDEIREELLTVWKKILEDLRTDPDFDELKEIMGWFETVMECNVPFGKQNRYSNIQTFKLARLKKYNLITKCFFGVQGRRHCSRL